MDEPDYNLRLEGFSDAKQLVVEKEEAVTTKVSLILPVLHNALFFLSYVSDNTSCWQILLLFFLVLLCMCTFAV